MKYPVVLSLLMLLSSCDIGDTISGSGNLQNETRPEAGFSEIKVLGPIDVDLKQGNDYAIEVETDDNIMPYVITEREGNDLRIKLRNNTNIRRSKIKVKVTSPTIQAISVSGSGSVKSDERISDPDRIVLTVSGSGDLNLHLKSPVVSARVTGSGKIVADGETAKMDLHIAGSGDFYGEELKSEEVKISVSGSGKAKVFASRELNVSVAGSGDVYYRGDPNIKQSIAGSGNIRRLN